MRQAYRVWIAVAAAVFCVVALVDLTTGTASRPVAARSAAPPTPTSTTLRTTTVVTPTVTTPSSTTPSSTTRVTTPTPTSTTTSVPSYGDGYDSGEFDGPSPGDQGLPDGALTGGYCARKWWC